MKKLKLLNFALGIFFLTLSVWAHACPTGEVAFQGKCWKRYQGSDAVLSNNLAVIKNHLYSVTSSIFATPTPGATSTAPATPTPYSIKPSHGSEWNNK